MKELTQEQARQVAGGKLATWAKVVITGACAAGGALIGIAGGPLGVGIGATVGAMAGAGIVAAADK